MKPPEIVARLRALSEEMIALGTAMNYFGGFDGRMVQRGSELVGAGFVAHEWAEEIETLTVTSSIDASASGNWHGFITNGEIR